MRDRDIGRFGEYVAGTLLGIGMVVPFILAITEADHFWIANAMYLVFVLQAIVGAVIKLFAYRRGLLTDGTADTRHERHPPAFDSRTAR